MKRDELLGRNDAGGLKKRPVKCCACRSTLEHRCYKCLCGKCPPNTKKVPPRYGMKDRSADSHPSKETEQRDIKSHAAGDESSKQVSHNHHAQSVSNCEALTIKESYGNQESMAYTSKHGPSVVLNIPNETRGHNDAGYQKVMTNDEVGGSSESHAKSTSKWDILAAEEPRDIKSHRAGDESSKQVSHNHHAQSGSNWEALTDQNLDGHNEAGNQKVMTNEDVGGSSKSLAESTSNWDILAAGELRGSGNQVGWANNAGSASTWGTSSEKKPRGNTVGSGWGTSSSRNQERRDNRAESEWGNWPRNEPRHNAAGPFSSRDDTRVGGQRDIKCHRAGDESSKQVSLNHHAQSGSNWEAFTDKNLDGHNEAGNQKVMTNEDVGKSSKSHAESTSNWDILAAAELRGSENQVGWANNAGSASIWGNSSKKKPRGNTAGSGWGTSSSRNQERRDTRAGSELENEPRRNAPEPFSSKDDRSVGGRRGNKEARYFAEDGSSRPISRSPHVESGSRSPYHTAGKRSRGDRERSSRIEDGYSEPVKRPRGDRERTSCRIKDVSSEPVKRPRGDRERMSSRIKDVSSEPVKRPRGDRERTSSRIEDVFSEPVKRPRGDRERTSSRIKDLSSEPVKRPRGDRERRSSRIGDVSSEPVKRPRGDRERTSSRVEDASSEPLKKARGSQEMLATSTEDESSTPVLVQANDHSGPLQARSAEIISRGKQVAMAYRTEDRSCRLPSGSYSRRDAYVVKDPISNADGKSRNQEIVSNFTKDGSSKPVLLNTHVESGSTQTLCTEKELRGNPEVTTNRAGYESSKQVLSNHHAPSSSSFGALTVEGPSSNGNQGIMASGAEVESSEILPDPNAGFASTLSSLTAKEPTGSSVSINLEGVLRENKKILDPAVASPRHVKHVKPPPIAVPEENYSQQEQEVYCSPAKDLIWEGNFEVAKFSPYKGTNEVFVANPAAKISAKAYGLACMMTGHLKFEMHPRSSFEPETFKSYCDANDIALYFYPQERASSMQEYTALLKHLTGHGRMLRSEMGQVELLVFSSKILTESSQKERGQHFLWGVFRQIWKDEDTCVPKVPPS